MSGFTRKILEVSLTLARGTFAGSGADTKTWRLGTDCEIAKPGLPAKNTARVSIFNIPAQDMESAATLAFRPLEIVKNRLTLRAGDERHGLSLVFAGDVISAMPDFSGAPDPAFVIEAMEGYVGSVAPAPSLTWEGEVPAAELFARLAAGMGYVFVNRGVTTVLRNVALKGGHMEQAQALARAARCEMILDDGELIILPPGSMRDDAMREDAVWAGDSGLLGYPSFSQQGISCKGLYDPRLRMGGALHIKSVVPKASGVWKIFSLRHHLQAGYPGAELWESQVETVYPIGL